MYVHKSIAATEICTYLYIPMGRKSLPPAEKKGVYLDKIRVSEEEKAKFLQKAKDLGIPFSELVRNLLTDACK